MYQWWACVPTLRGVFTAPGVAELFWELPPGEAIALVKGYQVRTREFSNETVSFP